MNLHVPACRLVGKVGADNSHKWVFRDNATESDPNLISSWNSSIEPVRDFFFPFEGKECQFNSSFLELSTSFMYSNLERGSLNFNQAFRLLFYKLS